MTTRVTIVANPAPPYGHTMVIKTPPAVSSAQPEVFLMQAGARIDLHIHGDESIRVSEGRGTIVGSPEAA